MDAPPHLGRRSSFSVQQEMNAEGRHESQTLPQDSNEPIIKSTDMPDVMQQHAIQCTQKAIEMAKEEGQKKKRTHHHQDQQIDQPELNESTPSAKKSDFHNFLAKTIKKEFDATYGGVFHCVVGKNFGSHVVHQSRTFIYFYLGQTAVLLFKSGSQAL